MTEATDHGRRSALRQMLGPVGAFLGVPDTQPLPPDHRDAVARLESVGYRTLWTNEVVGGDALVRASLWLASTDRLVVGTCVANMWVRPAPTAHAAASQLDQAFPGRFVLGVGVSHPGQAALVGLDYGSPVASARAYLEHLDDADYPRVLGANGPRMLDLARELTDGALPAGTDPAGTERARAAIGDDRLLIVYVGVRPGAAPTAVREELTAHLSAGADHVIVGSAFGTAFGECQRRLLELAGTLTDLKG